MRKIIVILLLIATVSCKQEPTVIKQETSMDVLSKNHALYSHTVREMTYDGCEYIVIDNGNATWGSHKGNCKNLIHQY